MKRFFSLMLVALLLVSAIPFAASAAVTECKYCGNKNLKVVDDPAYTVKGDCLHDSVVVYQCQNTSCNAYNTETVKAPGKHDLVETIVKAPTCKETGLKNITCSKGCTDPIQNNVVIPVVDHKLPTVGTVTTAATCSQPGVMTYACEYGCGYTDTAAIPATGNHIYNAAGKCGVCGIGDGLQRKEVTFIIESVNGVSKIYKETYVESSTVTVPSAELIANYEFKGWWSGRGGSGQPLTSGMTWAETTMADTYYAWYVYNPNKDGVSNITVTARCYIDNVGNSYLDIPVLTQAVPDNTNVFDWLTVNKNTTILDAVYAKVDTSKYEWKNRYFYNHNGTEVLTSQSTFADGPKAILIKLEAKDNTTRANVQLYLHSSSTSANPFRILDMNGYTSGMNVTRDAATNLIKQYYNYKNIGNLFTESDWNSLQNGENVAGRTSVYISDNGTYKIHVVVTNATTRSGSRADSSNPKTGDYITIAVTTMVLAAAAVLTLAEMKKRKMI